MGAGTIARMVCSDGGAGALEVRPSFSKGPLSPHRGRLSQQCMRCAVWVVEGGAVLLRGAYSTEVGLPQGWVEGGGGDHAIAAGQ